MNNIYQVIFNKSTQQFVVVSELAKSAGKPKAVSAGSVNIVSILQNFSEKRPLGTTDTQTNPRWRSSLTSVNAYLLQVVNYIEYFANFSDKSTACLVRVRTLAPSGG